MGVSLETRVPLDHRLFEFSGGCRWKCIRNRVGKRVAIISEWHLQKSWIGLKWVLLYHLRIGSARAERLVRFA